jgi:hypothetical protein
MRIRADGGVPETVATGSAPTDFPYTQSQTVLEIKRIEKKELSMKWNIILSCFAALSFVFVSLPARTQDLSVRRAIATTLPVMKRVIAIKSFKKKAERGNNEIAAFLRQHSPPARQAHAGGQ